VDVKSEIVPDIIPILNLVQVVLLSMSTPFAVIAAWGYRRTPFGVVVLGLPVACVGFTLSGAAELVGHPENLGALWTVGSVLGVAGFAWVATALVALLCRGARPDPLGEVLSCHPQCPPSRVRSGVGQHQRRDGVRSRTRGASERRRVRNGTTGWRR
jgi:hypothetical protein